MAPLTFSLLLTLFLLSSAIASASPLLDAVADDPLIRQVVSEGAEAVDELLHADRHFSLFKDKYRKAYATQEEHDYRFGVFKANLRRAKRHQLLDPSAVHGVTKFSDLTPEEFERSYLGLHKQKLKLPADAQQAAKLPTSNLPADFDWREHGAVGAVKDQGSCGSCWSFSTIGALEGAHYLATGELLSLSEQQLVDCDHECDPAERNSCDSGCNGGLMNNAFEYILKAGGVQTEKDYPYTGVDGTCKFNKNGIVAGVSNFSVVSIDDDQIAANLVNWDQCTLDADIHRRSFLPIHLRKNFGPRCCPRWLRSCWIRAYPSQGQAVLDHQELLGGKLGRGRLLQDLQGQESLWGRVDGIYRDCSPSELSVTLPTPPIS